MKSVSIVSFRINRIMSVSLAYHAQKSEFLNSFVSLISRRINRIIFTRVPLLKKEKKESRKRKKQTPFLNCLNTCKRERGAEGEIKPSERSTLDNFVEQEE